MMIKYKVHHGHSFYDHLSYDDQERLGRRLLNMSEDDLIIIHQQTIIDRFDDVPLEADKCL